MDTYDGDLYDQEYDAWREKWQYGLSPQAALKKERQLQTWAVDKEQCLRWEHDFGQRDYYAWFLDQVRP